MKMKNNFPNYLFTPDKKKIFYNTNFNPGERGKKENQRPLLVFNYGLVCNTGHWSKQIPYFDENGYRIILHNYRGHFNSTGSDDLESCHFGNFVRDLKIILDTLKAPPCFMLGHSMGVNITLEFAKDFPQLVRGIILVSGTVLPPETTMFDSRIMEWVVPMAKFISEQYPSFFKTLWEVSPLIPLIQKSVLMGGFNSDRVPLEFIQQYMNRIKQLPPQLFFHLFESMGDQGLLHHLKDIQTPALIIGGEKDKIVPNHFQEIFKKELPNSEFYLVKDGSHVPQVDFPEPINERIEAFIRKNSIRSSSP